MQENLSSPQAQANELSSMLEQATQANIVGNDELDQESKSRLLTALHAFTAKAYCDEGCTAEEVEDGVETMVGTIYTRFMNVFWNGRDASNPVSYKYKVASKECARTDVETALQLISDGRPIQTVRNPEYFVTDYSNSDLHAMSEYLANLSEGDVHFAHNNPWLN